MGAELVSIELEAPFGTTTNGFEWVIYAMIFCCRWNCSYPLPTPVFLRLLKRCSRTHSWWFMTQMGKRGLMPFATKCIKELKIQFHHRNWQDFCRLQILQHELCMECLMFLINWTIIGVFQYLATIIERRHVKEQNTFASPSLLRDLSPLPNTGGYDFETRHGTKQS